MELVPEVTRGYEVRNGNYMYNDPRARVMFNSNHEKFYDPIGADLGVGYEIDRLNGNFVIAISIEHLSPEIRKFVLLELNDDFKIGSLLWHLGIAKENHIRLGDSLYIIDNVEKEYVYDLYFYLKDLYYEAIEKYYDWEKRNRRSIES